jgi:flagellar protein FlaG
VVVEINALRVHAFGSLEGRIEHAEVSRADPATVVKAVEQINASSLIGERNELTFSFEQDSRRPILRIVDRETKEVVRQVPQEYVLRLARSLKKSR